MRERVPLGLIASETRPRVIYRPRLSATHVLAIVAVRVPACRIKCRPDFLRPR